jgi:uncharacterized integral membrane protein
LPYDKSKVRSLALIFKLILFLLLLGFATKNSETVNVRYFMDLEWQTPLSLLILVVFAAGLLMGLLACSGRLFRRRRELRQANRPRADQSG